MSTYQIASYDPMGTFFGAQIEADSEEEATKMFTDEQPDMTVQSVSDITDTL